MSTTKNSPVREFFIDNLDVNEGKVPLTYFSLLAQRVYSKGFVGDIPIFLCMK